VGPWTHNFKLSFITIHKGNELLFIKARDSKKKIFHTIYSPEKRPKQGKKSNFDDFFVLFFDLYRICIDYFYQIFTSNKK